MARSKLDLNVFLILVLCIGCQCKTDLSKYFRTCDRDSPELNECLVAAIQEGVANMAGGVPELELAPIDPHMQKEIKAEYNSNQIVAKMHMKNIKSEGLKGVKIHAVRAKVDDDRFLLEADVTQRSADVSGEYRGEGRLNTFHVNTRGHFNATMRKLKYTWKLAGTPEVRDGVTYCRITKFSMRPDVADMKVYASNIFPENPQLTELANSFSNQNWRVMYQELLPYAEDNWNKIGISIANKIFLQVPYNELFPSSS